MWEIEGKNTWSHVPCQTVHTTGSNIGCCKPHPEWPRNKAYPTVQMEEPTLFAFQPYIKTLNICLSKRLARHKITSVYMLPKNIYSIHPRKCGQVYSGQIGQSIKTGVTDHNWCI